MNHDLHPPLRNSDRQSYPSREEILKAIIAAGILANPDISSEDVTYISYKVNDIYLTLFENNESHWNNLESNL